MTAQAPCKNCMDRELGCHDRCKKYLDFKKESELQKNMIRKGKETQTLHMCYIMNQREKHRKSRH